MDQKKAIILCGGIPQLALVNDLKERGVYTILLDQNEKAPAVKYADKFYPVSTMDVQGVKEVAEKENVDFLMTVCADQMLLVVAQVSEMLGLPCYISYETAKNVSDKACMKRIFVENGVPTSKHVILKELSEESISGLSYPIIVKPVDSYSSRGVKKVWNYAELSEAFDAAVTISRTKTAVVEEFVEGSELTVDAYIENGVANVLCISGLDKIPGNNKFVIHRGRCPAKVTQKVEEIVKDTVQKIATAFELRDTPMLVQMITDGVEKVSVVEFCARTGGGVKFRLIKKMTGFDVVKAVADLTMGLKPHVEVQKSGKHVINEFLYCDNGVLDHLEGFEKLKNDGIISEYYQLKAKGHEFKEISSSGDRVACFTVEDDDINELNRKHAIASKAVKAISIDGKDLVRHDLIDNIKY